MSEIGESRTGNLEDYVTTEGSLRVYRGDPYDSAARIESFKNEPGYVKYELYAELQRRGYDMEFVLPRMGSGETDDYMVSGYTKDRPLADTLKDVVERAIASNHSRIYEDIQSGDVQTWFLVVTKPELAKKLAERLGMKETEEAEKAEKESVEGGEGEVAEEEAEKIFSRIFMSTCQEAMHLRGKFEYVEDIYEKARKRSNKPDQTKTSGSINFRMSKKYTKGQRDAFSRKYIELKNAGYQPLTIEEKQAFISAALDEALQETEIPMASGDDEIAD